jgi:copper chaperone CopZ
MKANLIVQNLKCGGCAKTISNKLLEIKAIKNVAVDVDSSKIEFDFNDENDVALVKDKLKSIGYPSMDETNSLITKAKSYVSCATGKLK